MICQSTIINSPQGYMRHKGIKALVCGLAAAVCMFGVSGCQDGQVIAVGNGRSKCFEPACVRVAGLTGIVEKQAQEQGAYVRAVAEVQDKYECRMKAPGRFRFELYEYQARSGQIKGERIVIWPDFDLGNQERNNQYWRDFLRAYEFSLPLLKVPSSRPVVLEVTFLSGGRRMSDTYLVK